MVLPHVALPAPEHEALAALTPAQWKAVLEAPAQAAAAWMTGAARQGHRAAQAVLGQWYLDGHGLPVHQRNAFLWFLRAAEQGEPMGMNMAGRCHEGGWGTDVDLPAALYWYRRAATVGMVEGMYNLANLLVAGGGVEKDEATAFALYDKAAGRGHVKSLAKVGRFWEDGRVVAHDRARAQACYRAGAEQGEFRAQYHHARLLAEDGQAEEALRWLAQVPGTATAKFMREAGPLLAAHPDRRFAAIGQAMVERLAG